MSVFALDLVKPLIGLSLSDAADDGPLQACLDAAEACLQRLTGLRLAPTAVTEWHCGTGSRFLRARHRPVRSITSAKVWPADSVNQFGQGDSANPPTALTVGRDCFLRLDFSTLDVPPVQLSLGGTLVCPAGWPGAFERRRGRVIPRPVEGNGNVELVLAVGFPEGAVPAEFLPAVAAAAKLLRGAVPLGGLVQTSESRNGWSVGLAGPAADAGVLQLGQVQTLLARYRRPFVG